MNDVIRQLIRDWTPDLKTTDKTIKKENIFR